MKFRPMYAPDFDKGFIETLSSLSKVECTRDELGKILRERLSTGVKTYVIEEDGKVIATASMFVEQKFIHSGGKVAHIEDVVVSPEYRGKGIGRKLMGFMAVEADSQGCYKIILDCSESNKIFYDKCGYYHHENQMRFDLK